MIQKMMIAMLGVVAASGVAGAVTIDTAPIVFTPGTNPTAVCMVVNNSTKPITAKIEFYRQDGTKVLGSPQEIAAHAVRTVSGFFPPFSQGFCRVEGKFSKAAVKVTLCAPSPGGEQCPRAVSN